MQQNCKNLDQNCGWSNSYFYKGGSTYSALQGAAGLYYSFGNISFSTAQGNYNEGSYISITNGTTTYSSTSNASASPTGSALFIRSGVASQVRLMTLSEVNRALGRTTTYSTNTISTSEDTKGLYLLKNLKSVPGLDKINYSSGYYWIASPYPNNSHWTPICSWNINGTHNYSSNDTKGVRPIVLLNGNKFKLTEVGNGTYKFTKVQ